MILLFLLVMGVLYFGWGTATEASTFGAVGAALITLARRRLTVASLFQALRNTLRVSTMITLIITCALLFGYFLTLVRRRRTSPDSSAA